MFLFRRPSDELVRLFIRSQSDLPFSYAEMKGTQDKPPPGYSIDHNRIRLGEGRDTYDRAVAAFRDWKHFDLGWVTIVPQGKPLEIGATVAVQTKTLGFWSLNAARIVYVIDEKESRNSRFGFAYGTLPDHVERGEERFTIERQED